MHGIWTLFSRERNFDFQTLASLDGENLDLQLEIFFSVHRTFLALYFFIDKKSVRKVDDVRYLSWTTILIIV